MGSINKGSFNLNKSGNFSHTNKSKYNQNAKFGNTKVNFKNAFKPVSKKDEGK